MPASERGWERLLDHLNSWGSAREVPGGVEVTFGQPAGEPRTVELVVTPAEWGGYVGTIWGVDDPADTDIRALLTDLPTDASYLVYDRDAEGWLASATRAFPPDPDDDAVPEPGGEWVTTDGQGNVVRYSDEKRSD